MPSFLSLDAVSRVRKLPPMAFRQSAEDRFSLEGQIYEWGALDEHGDYLSATGFAAARDVPVLLSHHHNLRIGSAVIDADNAGIFAGISLDRQTPLTAYLNGYKLNALSADVILPPSGVPAGRGHAIGQWSIAAVSLISTDGTGLVARPKADKRMLSSKADLVELLREAGLSKGAAAQIAARGWSGLNADDAALSAAEQMAERISNFTQSLRS